MSDATVMQDVRVTGRHMEVGDAFRVHVNECLGDIIEKHHDPERHWSAHVIMERTKLERAEHRFTAEVTVRLGDGVTFQAEGRAGTAHPAFDEAAERVAKRMRRHKRRLKEHRGHRKGPGPEAMEMAYAVLTAPEAEKDVPEDFAPAIVAESVREARAMSVADAVLSLDMGDAPVLVFRNSKNEALNLVYRRADGNVGWIDMARAGG